MLFGMRQRTWAIAAGFFLIAFLTLSILHLYIPHEHPHDGSYVMMPFLHATSNEKEATLLILVAVAVATLLNIHRAPLPWRERRDGARLLAHALELFRRLFSSGILHPKSH